MGARQRAMRQRDSAIIARAGVERGCGVPLKDEVRFGCAVGGRGGLEALTEEFASRFYQS